MIRFLWALALSLSLALQAQSRPFSTPLVGDENGFWVLRVELGTKGFFGRSFRTYRFLLDTGSSNCILDQSVAAQFFKPLLKSNADLIDANGIRVNYPMVSIHRIRIGDFTLTHVDAVLMDLKNGMIGSIQDEPLDGILGMNFLRNRSFTWDPSTRSILWKTTPQEGRKLPLSYNETGLPTLNLVVEGASFLAKLDTGASTGISIPLRIIQADLKGSEGLAFGLNSSLKSEKNATLSKIEAGPFRWRDAKISLVSRPEGTIGLSVFAHLKTGFDFKNHLLIFPDGPDHSLLAPFQVCNLLPIVWVRQGGEPYLKIPEMGKGNSFYQAGLRPGDVLLKVNDLKGPRLTRRAVQDAVRNGPTTWVILRNKKPLTVRVETMPPSVGRLS